jgi:hypothetical protein
MKQVVTNFVTGRRPCPAHCAKCCIIFCFRGRQALAVWEKIITARDKMEKRVREEGAEKIIELIRGEFVGCIVVEKGRSCRWQNP